MTVRNVRKTTKIEIKCIGVQNWLKELNNHKRNGNRDQITPKQRPQLQMALHEFQSRSGNGHFYAQQTPVLHREKVGSGPPHTRKLTADTTIQP